MPTQDAIEREIIRRARNRITERLTVGGGGNPDPTDVILMMGDYQTNRLLAELPTAIARKIQANVAKDILRIATIIGAGLGSLGGALYGAVKVLQ